MKSKTSIVVTVVLVVLVGSLQAGTIYWEGPVTAEPDATTLWSTGANWAGGGVPISTDTAFIAKDGAHALIEDGDNITLDYLQIGKFTNTTSYLDMTGGIVNCTRLYPAYGNYGAPINLVTNFSGDAVFNASYTIENRYGEWELNISDNAALTTPVFWSGRYGGHADINLSGGSLNITGSGNPLLLGSGTMVMDITEGILTQAGNYVATYEAMVGNQIIAYGGTGDVVVSYDSGADMTTVSAVPEPATMCLLGLGGLLLRRKK